MGFVLLGALWLAASAAADLSFCPAGAGAGQCGSGQLGLASDPASSRLYVADQGNQRIDVFEVSGGEVKFKFSFGAGSFEKREKIAVDADPASPSFHDIYIGTDNFRVQKFDPEGHLLRMWGWDVVESGPDNDTTPPVNQFEICVSGVDICKAGSSGSGKGQFANAFGIRPDPLAVGPGGTVFVADPTNSKQAEGFEARLEEFEPSGGLVEVVALPEEFNMIALAVDSGANSYGAFEGAPGVHKFHPNGSEFGAPFPDDPGLEATALASGEGDELFAAEGELRVGKAGGSFRTITEYTPAGAYLRRFGYGLGDASLLSVEALAPLHSANGDVFASLSTGANRIAYLSIPPKGPVIAAPSLEAKAGNTKATLAAEANPEGKATTYHFEYITEAEFKADGESFGAGTTSTSESAPIGSDFSLHAAEAQIGCTAPPTGECLVPETEYRYRVLATNADGKASAEGAFETKPYLEIEETWASEAGVEGARLNAKLNPFGIAATGYFEYVEDAKFKASGFKEANRIPDVGASPLDFGSGETGAARGATLGGLQPGHTYHYRLVATDALLEEEGKPVVTSPALAFRTFAKPAVAPCPNDELRAGAAAILSDCRAYEMVSPLDKNNGDIVSFDKVGNVPAALDQSAVSGERVSYTTYQAFGDSRSAPFSAEYIAERSASGWASHAINSPRTTLDAQLPSQLDTEFKLFSPDLCQAWVRTLAEPQLTPSAVKEYPNLYRRTDQGCGGAPGYEAITTAKPPHRTGAHYELLELQGASADGATAIFAAPDNLKVDVGPQPPDLGGEGQLLYERAGGKLSFVCILPGGTAVAEACAAGTARELTGAMTAGSFQHAISADGQRVFWSATKTGIGPGKLYVRIGGKETLAVSEEGEATSGTSGSQFLDATQNGSEAVFLTQGAGGVSDLYRYAVGSKATTPIAHEALGLVGMSEDGSRVYFISTEAIAGAANGGGEEAGQPNLYLDEGGSFRFIATLASAELLPTVFSAWSPVPIDHAARVSPDGAALAFMSQAPLTGYDNTDATSGEADAEVFLYDARANGGKGELICASCNPSGARPAGADVGTPIPAPVFWAAAELPRAESTLYVPRVLSTDGRRVFFESSDALSPLDTDGTSDVYEWERAGEGTCGEGSSSFVPASGGCVELISSGRSPRASSFLDADPSGRNAFFTTISSLVPQDYGLVDVYDAREGGGLPPPPAPRPECEGEACQSPPGPPGEVTGASAAFGGEAAVKGKKHKKKKGKKKRGGCMKAKPEKGCAKQIRRSRGGRAR